MRAAYENGRLPEREGEGWPHTPVIDYRGLRRHGSPGGINVHPPLLLLLHEERLIKANGHRDNWRSWLHRDGDRYWPLLHVTTPSWRRPGPDGAGSPPCRGLRERGPPLNGCGAAALDRWWEPAWYPPWGGGPRRSWRSSWIRSPQPLPGTLPLRLPSSGGVGRVQHPHRHDQVSAQSPSIPRTTRWPSRLRNAPVFQQIFPEGVCDGSLPGVEQRPSGNVAGHRGWSLHLLRRRFAPLQWRRTAPEQKQRVRIFGPRRASGAPKHTVPGGGRMTRRQSRGSRRVHPGLRLLALLAVLAWTAAPAARPGHRLDPGEGHLHRVAPLAGRPGLHPGDGAVWPHQQHR